MASGAEMRLDNDVETRVAWLHPRVLVVDEDAEHLASVKRTLSHHYAVQAETDVFQALVALEEDGPFALVICDLHTGGVDGIEFLERALEALPDAPRILMLNDATLVDAMEAVNRAKVHALITKPIDTMQLLRRVDEVTVESLPGSQENEWGSNELHQPIALASG
ncbi:MAG: response regulator [Acidimicrobiales bacterium]